MPKFYCIKCGSGTDYTFVKPKMCLKCNYTFGSLPTTQPVVSQPTNIVSSAAKVVSPVPAQEPYKPRLVRSLMDPQFVPQKSVSEPMVDDDDSTNYVTELDENEKRSFASVNVQRNCSSFKLPKITKPELQNDQSTTVTKVRKPRKKKA